MVSKQVSTEETSILGGLQGLAKVRTSLTLARSSQEMSQELMLQMWLKHFLLFVFRSAEGLSLR